MRRLLAIAALAVLGGADYSEQVTVQLTPAMTDWTIRIDKPDSDDGRHLGLSWTRVRAHASGTVLVLRRRVDGPDVAQAAQRVGEGSARMSVAFRYPTPGPIAGYVPRRYYATLDLTGAVLAPNTSLGEWTVVASVDGDPPAPILDEVAPGGRYVYALVPAIRGEAPDTFVRFPGDAITTWSVAPRATWFNRKRWGHLALIALVGASLFGFTWLAKRKQLFIRRLPGVDAIEDAVGRSTEMGRPILYVTGVEKAENIQTLASVLILGHVAEIAASYETDMKVANAYPLTMVIAEEVVRQGYANAGRADAHRPEDVLFITSEQFAFAAAVNGIIVRERPATNIYFGCFYAESLMLAETGFLTGAVQIAGTAELTQLPFFISACDFTLIGEELFACSAYLTREPNQIAMLKAGDVLKVASAVIVIVGVALATARALGWAVPFTIEDLLP